METPQARRSCANSQDTFTQSFLHRAWPKTRGPQMGSWSALSAIAYVFDETTDYSLQFADYKATSERAGPDFQAHLRYRHITLLSIVRSCNQRSINCIDDQVSIFPINLPSIRLPPTTLEVRLNNKLAIMIIC